ncbi:MAG: hypothetical protein RIR00_2319 [Pseudomonadota bacterium]|jgi:Zn-dependent protease with chaperone function
MLEAGYFDGHSARRQPVRLHVANDFLHLEDADGALRRYPLRDVDFGEGYAGAPRRITLPDGGVCEAAEGPALTALIAAAGHPDSLLPRLQRHGLAALLGVLILAGAAWALYAHGLPALGNWLAPRLPPTLVQQLSDSALGQLDRQLGPSSLPAERQEALRRAAAPLFATPLPHPPPGGLRLHFRHGGHFGANALALPGGDIVLLDELVQRLDDTEILAVLAHETGHLARQHALRQVIQGTALSALLAFWLGDVSSAAVGVSGLLLSSGYSRDAEREADAWAADYLRQQQGNARALIRALGKLEQAQPAEPGLSLLSSHPDTPARIAALEQGER